MFEEICRHGAFYLICEEVNKDVDVFFQAHAGLLDCWNVNSKFNIVHKPGD